MFIDHLFFYTLAARLLLGTTLLACLESIRLKYPNTTLLNLTLIFLASITFMLCKSSARFPDGCSDEAVIGSNTLYDGENRSYFSPGRNTPVNGKEGASC